MRKSQLDFLCKSFGSQDLPDNEKWKCIKYIYIENPIVDVELLIKKNEIKYIDNAENGAGFYILTNSNVDFGIPKSDEKLITFIPLNIIDKIALSVKSLNAENNMTIIV